MSYFPDYRKETDKLNEVDRAGITGFRIAVESAMFDNADYLPEGIDLVDANKLFKND